jgi:tellurite resistance protein
MSDKQGSAVVVAPKDPTAEGLARLVATLAEDAIFAFASADPGEAAEALEGIAKRRADAYGAIARGQPAVSLADRFDEWVIEMARIATPLTPPSWLPMHEVLRQKVTLEVGARGLRSLFSSKPSEKDVQRVKRYGTLAVRALRAVLAADGPLDGEEKRTVAALVGALGLPAEDATALDREPPFDPAGLQVYGELEAPVARGVVRGVWLAAAWDAIDPREEDVIRAIAKKLAVPDAEVESARADAVKQVDARKGMGLAAVDGVRYVLWDRSPGEGVRLAAAVGTMLLPRRYREEALAAVAHGGPAVLAKRHAGLSGDGRATVLACTWAAVLHDDPSLARRAVLRARYERVAADLGEDGARARHVVEEWVGEVVAGFATGMP